MVSVSISEPLMLPRSVGMKLMGRVQLLPAFRLPSPPPASTSGQSVVPPLCRLKLLAMLGLVPTPGAGTASATLPMFASTTVWGLSKLVEGGVVTAVASNDSDGTSLRSSIFTAPLPASLT